MKKLNYKKLFWLYIGAIVLLVALPINSAGELNNITILRLRGDYFFHILLFVPWAFFRQVFSLNSWLWLPAGILFASASEGLQHLLPYRAYNVNDLVANVIGVVLGFLSYSLWVKLVVRNE